MEWTGLFLIVVLAGLVAAMIIALREILKPVRILPYPYRGGKVRTTKVDVQEVRMGWKRVTFQLKGGGLKDSNRYQAFVDPSYKKVELVLDEIGKPGLKHREGLIHWASIVSDTIPN